VRVIRRGFTNAAVRATVSTTNDTATAGEDYEAVSTFVTFAAGETNKVVEIPLAPDDYLAEPDKSFVARITDLPPGATSPQSTATVLIRDDERPGSIDRSWYSDLGFDPDPLTVGLPTIITRQPDGKMIVNVEVPDADFNLTAFWRLLRLNADGSVDTSYPIRETYPSGAGAHLGVRKVHVLSDGGVLVFDSEFAVSHTARVRFRLRSDGSVDNSFPTLTSTADFDLIPQPDGKILVGSQAGVNTWVPVLRNGQSMPRYFRLNSDGSVDATFTGPANLGGQLHLMENGQLYLEANYAAPYRLYRLNANGSLDSSFNAPASLDLSIHQVMSNGQILATSTMAQQYRSTKLHRLNSDGSPDAGFTVGTAVASPNLITKVVVQPDGKLVVAGIFATYNGQICNSIVRLHTNGTIDPTFQSGQGFVLATSEGQVFRLWELPDGRMLADGGFDRFDGSSVSSPIILNPDGSRDPSFNGTLIDFAGLGTGSVHVAGFMDGGVYVSDLHGLARLRMDLPLRIVSTERDHAGTTRLTANALAGRSYTLQSSENLTVWADLATQPATTNRIEFTDAPTNSPAMRVYRVKQN
jgi:uncharacterized delta-60 repeat protein